MTKLSFLIFKMIFQQLCPSAVISSCPVSGRVPCLSWALLPPKHFAISAVPCLLLHNGISTLRHRMAKPDVKTNSEQIKSCDSSLPMAPRDSRQQLSSDQEGLKDTHTVPANHTARAAQLAENECQGY